jgi:acyl dehydratase
MAGESVRVGEHRYRERFGRYYEDFEVGATYEHRPGRTLSETDNTWFALLTMNTHPIHFDAEYAKHSEFGKPLVVSTLTLAILVGMSVSDTSQKAVANLGWEKITLPKPVFAGDTLYAESTVLNKRESKSRPDQGIVTIKTTGRNQKNEIVCEFERTMLVMRRGNKLEENAGY